MASHGTDGAPEDDAITPLDAPDADAPSWTPEPQSQSVPNLNLNPPKASSTAASSISNPALEVDFITPDPSGAGSGSMTQGVGAPSPTPSLRSHLYNFVEEHGRTFHRYREGKYPFPNDAQEQDRLDFQHHFMLILLEGRLQLAPIREGVHSVLDVGTGTGIWAIDFANRYPNASVIGTDLSPIQPDFVPPNCQFEIDDAEDDWLFAERFDFIHMRGLMACFSDPRSVLERAYHHCAPGGYLEMQDGIFPLHCHDDTLDGTALDIWGRACVEAGAKIGRPWNNAPNYKRWMEELGFEDVRERVFEVPTSTWPRGRKAKELGIWFHANMMDALGASKVLLIKAMLWQPEVVELLLMEVRKDLRNTGVHAYMPIYITYGRKPLGAANTNNLD